MKIFLLFSLLILSFSANAQIRLAGIFGDHMVLQRSQSVPVWGWTVPGEKVIVSFKAQHKETTADKNGKWRVSLDAEPAGGPFELSVAGKDSLVIHDVLIGEVWLCSGQSNMEFTVRQVLNANHEIASADHPEIRQIKIPELVSGSPKDDIQPAAWNVCSPVTVPDFTAVGYFFAREISIRLHVAVGLINSTWGGTMVETWTSRGAFEKSAEFKSMIAAIDNKDLDELAKQGRAILEHNIHLLEKDIPDSLPETEWKNPGYNSAAWPKISVAEKWEDQNLGLKTLNGVIWYLKEVTLDSTIQNKAVTLSLGTIDDADETFVNGIAVGDSKVYSESRVYRVPPGIFKAGRNVIAVRVEDTGGGGGFSGDSTGIFLKTGQRFIPLGQDWHFRVAHIASEGTGAGPNDYPGLLYNAMIHPLIPYGMRGVLWYQGENNSSRAFQYRTAFPLLISDWRQRWGQGNFPFYYVQLASFNAGNGNSEQGSDWAELREAQTRTLSVPATGMAVTTDIGDPKDIHPKNKQDVGLRLAAIALNNTYGIPMEYSGPIYESMTVEGNKVMLRFIHSGSGLMVKDKYGYVKGFEIAGADHHFHYARAFLENNKVVVYTDDVAQPVSVRYAWADDAGDANLYNQEGFPAVPFRTDQWKGATDDKKYNIGD